MSNEPKCFEYQGELYSYDYEAVTSGEALNAYDIGMPIVVIDDQAFTERQIEALATLDSPTLNQLVNDNSDLPF